MRALTRFAGFALIAAFLAACGSSSYDGENRPAPVTSISLTVSSLSATAVRMHATPTARFFVTVLNIADTLYLDVDHSTNGIADVEINLTSTVQARVDVYFRSPDDVAVGTHLDTIAVKICYDLPCTRHVSGSPATVSVNYTVTGRQIPLKPGLTTLSPLSRTELGHDIVDAEYSDALDAVVMVSASPANALHLFLTGTGERRVLPLGKAPVAISVSPDGLAAAVGHDELVTYVNLAELVQAGATTPVLLDSSARPLDLVLDGRGYVHVFPIRSSTYRVHSIEVATNTETLGALTLSTPRPSLHPSGDYIYAANDFVPGDIEKYDIRSGVTEFLYASPDQYRMCGNLWIDDDGQTIYTSCGDAFRSSVVPLEDMTHKGRLELTASNDSTPGYRIASLSRSTPMNEIMLVEFGSDYCPDQYFDVAACWTHLGLYAGATLDRTALYSIPPINVEGSDYMQQGLFVFHSADGMRRYMLSSVPWAPASPHYISVLQ
jgi:hypothetical protein